MAALFPWALLLGLLYLASLTVKPGLDFIGNFLVGLGFYGFVGLWIFTPLAVVWSVIAALRLRRAGTR